ncbi:Ig-like domain repeat protein, partial [Leucobacter sp. M11]|uniref:Ig-like domain repeat protein n=1 Tax=Leucobacter sp. M11 TaxID=2993565 RepID=UPI002D7FC442
NEAADRAYVSSPRNQAIVVYARSGANDWVYEQSLAPPGLPERVSSVGNTFGESLALDGDRLLIGVPNARVDNQNNTGFAYLLDLGTESWTPLIPETPRANSITGQSVALSGDRAALSAVQVRNAARLQVGGVYLWDLAAMDEPRFTSQPEEDSRVCLSSAGSGPAFGMSLAFDAETLFVGSPREVNYTADDPADPAGGCLTSAVDQGNTTQGAVYRFTHELEQIGGKILPPAGSYEYGHNIAVSENALLANTQHAPEYEGEVIVTDISTLETAGTGDENHRQRPTPAQTLTASNPSPGASFGQQLFGNALTVDGTRALVGTPDANDGAGAVYVFQPISPNVTPVTLTGTNLTLEYGESGSIGAKAANATSEGTISAEIAGTALEAVETAGGEAQIALPPGQFDVGEYPITLTFTPAGATEAVASTAEPRLTVAPAATETRLRAEPVPGGAAVTISGTVTAAHGTRPGGAVTLLLGGVEVAEAILDAEGSFALPEPLPVAADATLDARYPGDGNHLASSAAEELLAPGITGPGTP